MTKLVRASVLIVSMAAVAQAQSPTPEVEKKLKSFLGSGDRIGVMLYLIDDHPFFYTYSRNKGLADFLDGKIDFMTFKSRFYSSFSVVEALGKAVPGGQLKPEVYSIAGIEKNGWFDTPFRRAIVGGVGRIILARELFAEPGFWAGLASFGWGAVPYAAFATGTAAVHQVFVRHKDPRDVLLSVASYLVPGVAANFVPVGFPFAGIAKPVLTYLLGGLFESWLLSKAGSGDPKAGVRSKIELLWNSGKAE